MFAFMALPFFSESQAQLCSSLDSIKNLRYKVVMTIENSKAALDAISKSLAKVHKFLLNAQHRLQEDLEKRSINPYELLNYCTTNPNFVWLRKISFLMAQVDEAVDAKPEKFEPARVKADSELYAIFIDPAQHVDLKERLASFTKLDKLFEVEMADLKKQITAFCDRRH